MCGCPNYEGAHLISKCPFSGVLEGETVLKIGHTEPWGRCSVCHLCHQGTCPCAKCGELVHIAADCIVAGMEDWSHIPTSKRSRRDQISPEKKKSLTTVANHMWYGKCGVSHPQNEPCRCPDVSKSLWCSTCGGKVSPLILILARFWFRMLTPVMIGHLVSVLALVAATFFWTVNQCPFMSPYVCYNWTDS